MSHLLVPRHVARSLVLGPHRGHVIKLLIMVGLIRNATNSARNQANLGTVLRRMVPHMRQLLILRRRLRRSTRREVLIRRLNLRVLRHNTCLSEGLAQDRLLPV